MLSDAEELVRSDLELLASAGDLDPDHTDLLHNLPEPPPEESTAFDESLFADLELDDDDDVLDDPDYEPPQSPTPEATPPKPSAAPTQKAAQKPSVPAASAASSQSREQSKPKQAGTKSKK